MPLVSGPVTVSPPSKSLQGQTQAHAQAAGPHLLELKDVHCGVLKSVKGGDVYAEVIEDKQAKAPYTPKRLGQNVQSPFVLEAGLDMSHELHDWIKNTWVQGQNPRWDGAIVTGNDRVEFHNAILSEVTLPALDAGSKEPGYLKLTVVPTFTQRSRETGKIDGSSGARQKKFVASNFRLEIPGLDCSHVVKVDALTVKQQYVRGSNGVDGGLIEFPNLRVELAAGTRKKWDDFFEEFVVKRNCTEHDEKTGTLRLLSPNLQDALATITFHNLGIFKLVDSETNPNRVVAELYCVQMEFDGPKA